METGSPLGSKTAPANCGLPPRLPTILSEPDPSLRTTRWPTLSRTTGTWSAG